MRRWTKYSIVPGASGVIYKGIDSEFSEHSTATGGYDSLDAYIDQTTFFNKWFFDAGHCGRLQYYDNFIRKHIKASDEIFSIASGRSANEIRFLLEGFNIVCSDLQELPSYQKTRLLFPTYKFVSWNILDAPTAHKYDGIISLSLIYLFDRSQLDVFFRNVSNSLAEGGYLILDSAGSPDNLTSRLLFEFLLKFEIFLVGYIKRAKSGFSENYAVSIKAHGYRYNDIEIIDIAARNGFILMTQENYGFLLDFQRSRILRYIMKIPGVERIFAILGRTIPYSRMYLFRKRN